MAEEGQSLAPHIKASKVSSVLNGDRQFGKQHLFDGNPESCWNSDQGTPQFIVIRFASLVDVQSVTIMFQGGFVGKVCSFRGGRSADRKLEDIATYEPADTNDLQAFEVHAEQIDTLKIEFPESSDFFGRITIYNLDIQGVCSNSQSDDSTSDSDSD